MRFLSYLINRRKAAVLDISVLILCTAGMADMLQRAVLGAPQ